MSLNLGDEGLVWLGLGGGTVGVGKLKLLNGATCPLIRLYFHERVKRISTNARSSVLGFES